jgi:hypothetical protein
MKIITTLLLALSSTVAIGQATRTGDYHLDQDYKINEKGMISLRCSDAKVYITGSKRANVHVKIDREVESKGFVMGDEEFYVKVEEQNGDLVIEERKSSNVSIVGYYNEKFVINIEAPAGVSLRVRGDDGDYFIKSMNGSVDMDVDDADVELAGCDGDNFTFRIDDGDIKMDQGRGSLDVSADDADVEIQNAKFSKINAQLDDGDFIVQTSLAEGGDYFIDAQDGSIVLTVAGGSGKFDIRHDDASVRADDAFETVEKSDDRTRLTLGNGTAKVDIRADDARVRLAKQ